jgi:hypothetical protein
MTITVQIDTSTSEGKRLEKELRRHPKSVRFIETNIVAENIPEGYIALKTGFEEVRNHIKSLYNKESESE